MTPQFGPTGVRILDNARLSPWRGSKAPSCFDVMDFKWKFRQYAVKHQKMRGSAMISKVFDFLFGKTPAIFDKDGSVRHDLPKEKWDAWKDRYQNGDEYNWRNHAGMRAKENVKPKN